MSREIYLQRKCHRRWTSYIPWVSLLQEVCHYVGRVWRKSNAQFQEKCLSSQFIVFVFVGDSSTCVISTLKILMNNDWEVIKWLVLKRYHDKPIKVQFKGAFSNIILIFQVNHFYVNQMPQIEFRHHHFPFVLSTENINSRKINTFPQYFRL